MKPDPALTRLMEAAKEAVDCHERNVILREHCDHASCLRNLREALHALEAERAGEPEVERVELRQFSTVGNTGYSVPIENGGVWGPGWKFYAERPRPPDPKAKPKCEHGSESFMEVSGGTLNAHVCVVDGRLFIKPNADPDCPQGKGGGG